jgi:glycosyltransferase involved in cell wall biosynthesis
LTGQLPASILIFLLGCPQGLESFQVGPMPRLLFVLPGLVPPGEITNRDKLFHLSEIADGEALLPVWWDTKQKAPSFLRQTFPEYKVGRFRYHLFLSFKYPTLLRGCMIFLYYILHGLKLHRENRFDAIVAYGTNTTGLAAVVLKWLTGAKLIVEVPGIPENAYKYDRPNQSGLINSGKRFLARRLFVVVGSRADCIKLLYSSQLIRFPALNRKRTFVFHDFVPVRTILAAQNEERFILSVGHPWYTKGMDLLIKAFILISSQHPAYKLKLMGYFPDRKDLENAAQGHSQIEFLAPRPNDLTLQVIGNCSLFVLASRTEGMGRVLLEAMAAGKPIVAAAVGGVPHYVQDGVTGLLFRSENAQELSEKIGQVLGDDALRARLAARGRVRVLREFDERAYVRSFQEMLNSLGSDSRTV